MGTCALRAGASPQAAIHAGYERAFATILDSNITTLIAGLALLAFGSGFVRGFAVVHCLGILTSMFSAVMNAFLAVRWPLAMSGAKVFWIEAKNFSLPSSHNPFQPDISRYAVLFSVP